jgi:protein-S-isoprenylcysteine O-methyltransferase Ste14
VVALCFALAMWAADRFLPGRCSATSPRTLIAGGLFALALVVASSAAVSVLLSRSSLDPHRPEKSTALVTRGMFRLSRNPMYLGMALSLLGWAVWLGRPWLVVGPAAFVLYITRFQILPEERALAEKFGLAYQAYRRTTRRWL